MTGFGGKHPLNAVAKRDISQEETGDSMTVCYKKSCNTLLYNVTSKH
jgi:hypothetical protein